MRLFLVLNLASLAACATASNRHAGEPADPTDADPPSIIDSTEVCENGPAKTPEPGADCDTKPHGMLSVTAPDEHWTPVDTKEYEFLIVHDETNAGIGFRTSAETLPELIAKFRERARLDGETAAPTKYSAGGTKARFSYTRTAGNGKTKATIRGIIAVRELAGRPGVRLILIGVWPARNDKRMRADFLQVLETVAVE